MGFFRQGALSSYGKGFLVGVLLFVAIVIGGLTVGAFIITVSKNMDNGISIIFPLIAMLLGFVVQGATEEIIIRGWVMPVIGARYNVIVGIVVSSAFFTIMHGANPGITILPIINLFAFSLFASCYVIYTKNLWAICGLHASWNWVQGNVFGIKVSGMDIAGGSILNTKSINGMELFSGGSFGVEGSIFCTIIFILATLYLVYKITRKHSFKIHN
jgi:membrane protease YdiL (CAAX protease family)